jgi:hypothetical protein
MRMFFEVERWRSVRSHFAWYPSASAVLDLLTRRTRNLPGRIILAMSSFANLSLVEGAARVVSGCRYCALFHVSSSWPGKGGRRRNEQTDVMWLLGRLIDCELCISPFVHTINGPRKGIMRMQMQLRGSYRATEYYPRYLIGDGMLFSGVIRRFLCLLRVPFDAERGIISNVVTPPTNMVDRSGLTLYMCESLLQQLIIVSFLKSPRWPWNLQIPAARPGKKQWW